MGTIVNAKLRDDIDRLIVIAQENNRNIKSDTLKHLLNEKNAMSDYENIVDYLAESFVYIVENNELEDSIADIEVNGRNFIQDSNKILIEQKPLSVEGLIKRLVNHEINLDTDFQRKRSLWSDTTKSQLIESLMLRIPIPPLYFDGTNDDGWLVIDGLQRLCALQEFIIDKTLKLTGLEFFGDYDGCGYDDLPRTYSRRIDETQLALYLILPGTPDNVKYSIFKRINTPGLKLEPQEIRHALYQGKATRLLQELADSKQFLKATGEAVSKERMQDREYVLRYMALKYLGVDKYEKNNGRIDDYLAQTMEYLNHRSNEEINEYKKIFLRTLEYANHILGIYAFRKVSKEANKRRGPMNVAIFESWLVALSEQDEDTMQRLERKSEVLLDKYMDALMDNQYSSDLSSGKIQSVRRRIERARQLIREVCAGDF